MECAADCPECCRGVEDGQPPISYSHPAWTAEKDQVKAALTETAEIAAHLHTELKDANGLPFRVADKAIVEWLRAVFAQGGGY